MQFFSFDRLEYLKKCFSRQHSWRQSRIDRLKTSRSRIDKQIPSDPWISSNFAGGGKCEVANAEIALTKYIANLNLQFVLWYTGRGNRPQKFCTRACAKKKKKKKKLAARRSLSIGLFTKGRLCGMIYGFVCITIQSVEQFRDKLVFRRCRRGLQVYNVISIKISLNSYDAWEHKFCTGLDGDESLSLFVKICVIYWVYPLILLALLQDLCLFY